MGPHGKENNVLVPLPGGARGGLFVLLGKLARDGAFFKDPLPGGARGGFN
jgi:hypothetical protein